MGLHRDAVCLMEKSQSRSVAMWASILVVVASTQGPGGSDGDSSDICSTYWRCRSEPGKLKHCADMLRAYSSACRVIAGVNPAIPSHASVSGMLAHDLSWHADTPNELGDSGEDPITAAELRTMTLRRMRKVVLQKAKAVQKLAKSKFRELRAVDKTLLEQR